LTLDCTRELVRCHFPERLVGTYRRVRFGSVTNDSFKNLSGYSGGCPDPLPGLINHIVDRLDHDIGAVILDSVPTPFRNYQRAKLL
jgi:hypothetical protein